MRVGGTLGNRAPLVVAAVLLAQIAAHCGAQVLEQVSIDPTAREYQPIVVGDNVVVRVNSDGSFAAADLNSNRELWHGDGVGGPIVSGTEDGSGAHFASVSSDGALRFWDFKSGRLLRAEPPTQDRFVRVKLSPDGQRVFFLSSRGRLVISDWTTGRWLTSVSWSSLAGAADIGTITAVAFDAKSTMLLIGTSTGTVCAWTLSESRVHFVKRVGVQPITAIAMASTGRWWAIGDASGVINLLNSASADIGNFAPFISIAKPVTHLGLDSSGQLLLACSAESGMSENAQDSFQMVRHVERDLPCAAFGADGKDVYASDHLGHLRRWAISQDKSTLPILTLYPPHDWNIGDPDGPLQLFSNLRGTSFGHFWVLRLPVAQVGSNAHETWPQYVPNEVILESSDRTLVVRYSPVAGVVLENLNKPEHRVQVPWTARATSFAISTNQSRSIVIGYGDGHVAFLRSGEIYNTIQISNLPIVSIAADSDSESVAVADSSGSVILWRPTESDGSVQSLVTVRDIVEMRFSPSSNDVLLVYCVSGLKFFDLGKHETSAALFVAPGLDWLAVTKGGFFDGPLDFWSSVRIVDSSRGDALPVNAFARDFYYPQVLRLITEGHALKGQLDLAKVDRQPPTVRIQASYVPSPDTAENKGSMVVKLNAEEARPGGGLRDLRLFRNGILLRAWRGDLPLVNGHFSAETSLQAGSGTQRLTAYCFNKQDVKGNDADLELFVSPTVRSEKTLHILAIGISKYESPILSLNYAEADAMAFSETLSKSFQQLGEFNHIKIYPLINEDATRKNLLLALRRLSGGSRPLINSPLIQVLHEIEVPGPDDVVVVYYAGHAGMVDNEFRLFPYDVHFYAKQGGISVDAMKATSISEDDLSRSLERIDGSHFILVVDACQSGQLLVSSDPRLGPINARGFAQLAFEKGMSTIVAARPEQVALEDDALKHGLLTYALIGSLSDTESHQRSDKQLLTLGEWFDEAAHRVPQLDRQINSVVFTPKSSAKTADPGSQRPIVFFGRGDNRQFIIHKGQDID